LKSASGEIRSRCAVDILNSKIEPAVRNFVCEG
jgi:hypothetical protein